MGCSGTSARNSDVGDVDIGSIIYRLRLKRLSEIQDNTLDFTVGKISTGRTPLIAPVSGKQCVYYMAIVEKSMPEYLDKKKMEYKVLFVEEGNSDFYLCDPSSKFKLLIQGKKFTMRCQVSEESKVIFKPNTKFGLYGMIESNDTPQTAMDMCLRNGIRADMEATGLYLRYTEYTFCPDEYAAALGVIKTSDMRDEVNSPIKILEPATGKDLDMNIRFLAENSFDDFQERQLRKLLKDPAIICTDDLIFQDRIYVSPNANKSGRVVPVATSASTEFKHSVVH